MSQRFSKELLSKIDRNETEHCCSNDPVYTIEYSLGKKWLVCNECLEIEYFNSDIREKVRIK